MRLIINADDLGMSLQVNDSIFGLMARRLITSATILANGPFFEDAARRIPQLPWCSFGVHLNLTQFAPLTDDLALLPLLDERGHFSRASFRRAHLSSTLRQAVLTEWSAQVNKILSSGIRISHLDSHHDVHTDPRLFLTLKRLQRRFGLRKVRSAANLHLESQPFSLRNSLWNLALRVFYTTRTVDGFTEFATFLKIAPDYLLPYSTMELMAHPGHPNFIMETAALETAWSDTLPFPVQLINYHEL
jgi:chitin disaccharide deacetylase